MLFDTLICLSLKLRIFKVHAEHGNMKIFGANFREKKG